MIAKQVVGRHFAGALDYVAGKEGAVRIGGNMAGETRSEIVDEFRVSEGLNHRVERTVYHVSLSTPPDETIDDVTWRKVARRYLDDMGFRECQWVMYRHKDTEHGHVHILAARVRVSDGSAVSDAWNYPRSEKALRAIERDFGLHQTPSSRELRQRAPKTGEMRMMRRTGQESVRLQLQKKIAEAASASKSVTGFSRRLAASGIEVRLRKDREGKILGASFAMNGIAFQGRQLGVEYSWTQLGQQLKYDPNQETTGDPRMPPSPSLKAQPPVGEVEATRTNSRSKEEEDVVGTRRELRQKYLQLQARVRERVVGIDRDRRLMDVAVAILALRDLGDIEETRVLLTQSDRVRDMSRELQGIEYRTEAIQYIHDVTDEAVTRTYERQPAALVR